MSRYDHPQRLNSSKHINKKLLRADEIDPSRWGHSGYKEQYPEDFASTDEERDSGECSRHKTKKRKKRKLVDGRENKRMKRQWEAGSTSSDEDGDSSSTSHGEAQKRRKKKRRKSKKLEREKRKHKKKRRHKD